MINKTYCVYLHRNKINGKVYIGQTINGDNPNKRWNNGKGYCTQTKFYKAIQKYGWETFDHTILEEGLSREEANERELFYILKYKSCERQYGYNTVNIKGSDSSNRPISCRKVCQLSKQGILLKTFNSIASADRYLKNNRNNTPGIVEACNNPGRTKGGFQWCYKEDLEKRAGIKSRCKGLHLKKPVCQLDINTLEVIKQFSCIREASKELKICEQNISHSCSNIQYVAGGFRWCLLENLEETRNSQQKIVSRGSHNKVAIYQLDIKTLGVVNEFECIKDASEKTGAGKTNISSCCRKLSQTAGGFAWCYKEDYGNFKATYTNEDTKKKPVYHISYDDKTIINRYDSINQALKKIETINNKGVISARCNGKIKSPMKDGTTFCFVNDYDKVINKK